MFRVRVIMFPFISLEFMQRVWEILLYSSVMSFLNYETFLNQISSSGPRQIPLTADKEKPVIHWPPKVQLLPSYIGEVEWIRNGLTTIASQGLKMCISTQNLPIDLIHNSGEWGWFGFSTKFVRPLSASGLVNSLRIFMLHKNVQLTFFF